MDRFVSNFTTRLDAKGRVSIPAPFRAVLARDGSPTLYTHPSLDWPTLDCGGQTLLSTIETLLAAHASAPAERDALAMTLLGEGEMLKVDGEGRIGLTEPLKQHAGITGEVSFVGVGFKFQIWEPERFRARLAEARARAMTVRRAAGQTPS